MELILVAIGYFIGIIGTLLGVGGGFLLLPTLMFIFSKKPHEIIVASTMTVIMVNAIFGVISYSRLGRINYKAGIIFAFAAVPFAVLGSVLTTYIPGTIFKIALGILLFAGAIFMFMGKDNIKSNIKNIKRSKFLIEGKYIDGSEEVKWNYDARKGFGISGIASFFASLMGIGGGVFHVPAMVKILGFPIGVAAATSQFIIVFMSSTSFVTHLASGNLNGEFKLVLLLCLGTIPGAFTGVKLSRIISSKWIVRIFAIIMVIVSIQVIYSAF